MAILFDLTTFYNGIGKMLYFNKIALNLIS